MTTWLVLQQACILWMALSSHIKLTKRQHSLSLHSAYHNLSAVAVNAWLSAVASDDARVADSSRFELMKEMNKQLSIPQPDQLTAQQFDLAKFIPDDDNSVIVDLVVDVGSTRGDKVLSRGVRLGAFDYGSSVSDLTAEVDFEIGPDVSSESLCNFFWHSLLILCSPCTNIAVTQH